MKNISADGRIRRLSFDDLEQVIGGNGGGDGVRVSCNSRNCSNPKFMIPVGRTSGTCPECGATVYVNK